MTTLTSTIAKTLNKPTGETLQIVDSAVLLANVKRWKYNRPTDDARTMEISEFIKKHKRVDGFISIAKLNGELLCYDGQNRLEALRKLGSTFHINVFMETINVATHDEIKERFFALNKAIPVPDLYTADIEDEERAVIKEKQEYVSTKLDKMFGGTRGVQSIATAPKKPHYNSENIKNVFYEFFKKNSLETGKGLWDKILAYNENEKNRNDNVELPLNNLKKCSKTGCFLFARESYIDFLSLVVPSSSSPTTTTKRKETRKRIRTPTPTPTPTPTLPVDDGGNNGGDGNDVIFPEPDSENDMVFVSN
jgi:hypothetical protein